MNTSLNDTLPIGTTEKKSCCGACASKANSLNAHCGKIHSLEELTGENNDITNFKLKHWQLDSLIDYISEEYHECFYKHEPMISGMLHEIAVNSAVKHDDIYRLQLLFTNLKNIWCSHLLLEERVLFPYIKNMLDAKRTSSPPPCFCFITIDALVDVLQSEHVEIDGILETLKIITGNYTSHPHDCAKMRLVLHELKDLHYDMEKHLFIEKNILFKKAVLLEQELKSKTHV